MALSCSVVMAVTVYITVPIKSSYLGLSPLVRLASEAVWCVTHPVSLSQLQSVPLLLHMAQTRAVMLIRRALKFILFDLHLQRSLKNVNLYFGKKKVHF